VLSLLQLAELLGCPYRLLVKDDNNATYPKLRGNEDYGPMFKLLSKHGEALVKALQLAPDQELAWIEVIRSFLKLDDLMKRVGCDTDAQKEECKQLGTQLILRFFDAGGQHSELNNYMLMLLFIGDFQPNTPNVNYLRLGHCLNCPKDWNPLERHANLKAADDEGIENGHRVMKQDNTHCGGGVFVQHQDTCPEDKLVRDEMALELRTGMGIVRLVERVEQKVQLAGRTHSAPYKQVMVDFEDEQQSVLYVLEHFHDSRDLRFQTVAALQASGTLDAYIALRAECAMAAGLTLSQVESWLSSKACGGKHYLPHPNTLLPQHVCLVKEKEGLEDYCIGISKPQKKAQLGGPAAAQPLQPPPQQPQQPPRPQQPQPRKRAKANDPRQR
jgi:hypothetical protein